MTPWLIALALARSLDAASSAYALQQPGLAEGVAWMPKTATGQIALQAGITTGQVYLYRHIGKTRPKLAKGLSLLQVGMSGTVFTMNVRVIKSIR
jgi:hypothetical protein